jgi:hypothetical protein
MRWKVYLKWVKKKMERAKKDSKYSPLLSHSPVPTNSHLFDAKDQIQGLVHTKQALYL